MKNYTSLILGVVIVGLIVWGIVYSLKKNPDTSGVATTTTQTTNDNTGSAVVPQSTLPIAVSSSSVSPTDTTAIVNGTVNPKGAFTSYWYEYGRTADLGSKTSNQTIGSGFVTISAPGYITGLTKNTTYYFKLFAENQNGRVSGTEYTFTTTQGTPAPVGSAPTTKTLSANGVTKTTANLNGEVTPNQNSTQYWFEYGKTPDLGNTSAFSSVGDGKAKVPVSISLSDLTPQTTYYFRINAQNQFGTINGAILNFKTSGPAAGVNVNL